MKIFSRYIILLVLTIGWWNTYSQTNDFIKYTIDSLVARTTILNKPWNKFFDGTKWYAGIYQLPQNGVDKQPVHDEDEIYILLKGEGKLIAGDSIFQATQGSVFFVKAHIPHRFIDIKQPLTVLVLFSKATPSDSDISAISYKMSALKSKQKQDKKNWLHFHKSRNISLNIHYPSLNVTKESTKYMDVPEGLYIVTDGNGYLHYNGKKTAINKGDILYLPGKKGYYFSSLKSKFEVLVFSE